MLEQARILEDGSGLVFPSPAKPGHELSDMTLTKLLRDNNLAARATIHGFRASFRSWTLEKTDTPWAIGEAAPRSCHRKQYRTSLRSLGPV